MDTTAIQAMLYRKVEDSVLSRFHLFDCFDPTKTVEKTHCLKTCDNSLASSKADFPLIRCSLVNITLPKSDMRCLNQIWHKR